MGGKVGRVKWLVEGGREGGMDGGSALVLARYVKSILLLPSLCSPTYIHRSFSPACLSARLSCQRLIHLLTHSLSSFEDILV